MGLVDINSVAAFGAIRDVPPYMLPPEAWTLALNMRAIDDGLESLLGWEAIFGTPTVAPSFLMPVSSVAINYWLYASLSKVYVFDGTSHTNITRQTAAVDVNYTASVGEHWNSTLLGGIPILNNGDDVPQYWAPISVAQKLQNLTNWPGTLRARVLRAFGPYLVAFNVVDTGVSFPHLVQWSHPADPGSVPSSWDYTDPTKDAGRTDLPDTAAGVIQDALPLSSTMFIYKENSVHKMTFIGGRSKFDFGEGAWLPSIGLLAPRCAVAISDGKRHVFASQDDILWHNGNDVDSILDRRQRRRLQNEIDTDNFGTSFMFDNPVYREAWFCYPGAGAAFPDRALILNYSDKNKWVITEVDGIAFRHAISGLVEAPGQELWSDNPTETWDQDTGPWSQLLRRRVLGAGTAATKIFNLDKTVNRDGVGFATTLRREGISVLGQDRRGAWIVDFQIEKMLKRLWPKIRGGVVNVRVGSAGVVDGPVTWGPVSVYDPSLMVTADILPITGRANAIEFSTSGGVSWRLDGYKMDIDPVGGAGGLYP